MIYIKTLGSTKLRSDSSGLSYIISGDRFEWEPWRRIDRDLGPEVIWGFQLDEPDIGRITWTFSEYPTGQAGEVSVDVDGFEVLSSVSVEIEYERSDIAEIEELVDGEVIEPETVAAIEQMEAWFFSNFGDPSASLPYISSEGGFQWVRGGPVDATEALTDRFKEIYSADMIEAAAEHIFDETGIDEWSPLEGSDDFDNNYPIPPFDDSDAARELSDLLPLAEELVINDRTGAFDVRPREIVKPALLEQLLLQIQDSMDDATMNFSNGLNSRSFEIKRLSRMMEHYRNNPQRIEMDLTTVHASLTKQISVGEIPSSAENQALLLAVREGALAIRSTHPDIYKNRQILQNQALRELTTEEFEAIESAAPALQIITEGGLHHEIKEDLSTIDSLKGNFKVAGVTREDAMVPYRDEVFRLLGRAARMQMAIRAFPSHISSLRQSPVYHAVEVTAALASLVSLGITLFLLF